MNFKTMGAALLLAASAAQAGEPIWDANKVELKTHKLAEGVYAMVPADAARAADGVPLATTSGILSGSKGVLVVDTMINERLHKQVMAEAKRHGAVRYAVNTSYHGDHSYGNYYLPKSTTVIQHAAAKAYVDANFAKDVQFMEGAFGKGRGIDKIKPRTGDVLLEKDGRMQLDLGGKVVEIIDFGFGQTGGDLVVWDPQAKVAFTGNPVIAGRPSLPWLLDGHVQDTLDTLTRLYNFLPADARIVPGHGPVIGKQDMKWHLDYLAALKAAVQDAHAQGMTLEQAQAHADLPAFQGYAIYDWVHKGINIPAAYAEFRQ
ncbi:MBL fold metallo-hydrolase [Pseudoduganella violaceinigra]|uniref:MBL fold metallo-hydrolase n=1 Tax=Pseudoduganella violaceinigra TaxID=246602 RepID=UPI00042322CA|nr:MBL fold metallo-hydrolase [Pseudoduganella violaceinigra]